MSVNSRFNCILKIELTDIDKFAGLGKWKFIVTYAKLRYYTKKANLTWIKMNLSFKVSWSNIYALSETLNWNFLSVRSHLFLTTLEYNLIETLNTRFKSYLLKPIPRRCHWDIYLKRKNILQMIFIWTNICIWFYVKASFQSIRC